MHRASSQARGERDAAGGGGTAAPCLTWDRARGGPTTQPRVVPWLGRAARRFFPGLQRPNRAVPILRRRLVCFEGVCAPPPRPRGRCWDRPPSQGHFVPVVNKPRAQLRVTPRPGHAEGCGWGCWGQPQELPPKARSPWSERPRVRAAPGSRVGVPGAVLLLRTQTPPAVSARAAGRPRPATALASRARPSSGGASGRPGSGD